MKIANPYCIRLLVKSICLLIFLIGALCGYVSYTYIVTTIHCCCSEDAKTLSSKFSHDPDGLNELQRRLYCNKSSLNNSHVTSMGVAEENDTQHSQMNHATEELEKRIRVICWITINPDRYIENGSHIKATWGKRCNQLLFMRTDKGINDLLGFQQFSDEDESLPTIDSPRVDELQHWDELKEAFEYIHTQYSDYDYILKANDDTYVILENLRLMLTSFDPNDPFYISCKLSGRVKLGHMSGVTDYVLSKEAVQRFVSVSIPPKKYPHDNNGAEHFEIGKYFELIGIKAVSRDIVGSGRFLPYLLQDNNSPEHKYLNSLFWKHVYDPIKKDIDCCSNNEISFHDVPPGCMYVLDYLIYHLRPYGVCQSVHNINTIDSRKKD